MIISSSLAFNVTSLSGDTEIQPELTSLHVAKLICAFWPIAQKQFLIF